MQKKKLVTMVAALGLVGAIGVGSTMAYLTDSTHTSENTVTVGHVTIDLSQSETTYKYGTGYVDNDGENFGSLVVGDKHQYNEYTMIVPGDTVFLDPSIIVRAGSANSYVLMSVTGLDEMAAEYTGTAADWTININSCWKLVKPVNDEEGTLDGIYMYVEDDATTAKEVKSNGAEDNGTLSSDVNVQTFFVNDVITYNTTAVGVEKNANNLIGNIQFKAYAVQASHVDGTTASAVLEAAGL